LIVCRAKCGATPGMLCSPRLFEEMMTMRGVLGTLAGLLFWLTVPALALDLPARKAGQWELKLSFDNGAIPVQTLRQCIDAATDKLMKSDFGGPAQQSCQQQAVTRSGAALIVDSVCTTGGGTSTTRSVVTGDFDSAYTMEITSKAGGDETHMTIAAKWLGPCAADQRPGDMIMSNGMKMNVLDMQKAMPNLPKLPQR
jgi:hypothetical protein